MKFQIKYTQLSCSEPNLALAYCPIILFHILRDAEQNEQLFFRKLRADLVK